MRSLNSAPNADLLNTPNTPTSARTTSIRSRRSIIPPAAKQQRELPGKSSATSIKTPPRRGPPTSSLLSGGGTTIAEPRRTIRATISSTSLRKEAASSYTRRFGSATGTSSGSKSIEDKDPDRQQPATTQKRSATLPRVALTTRDHNAGMARPVAKGSNPLEKGRAAAPTLAAKPFGRATTPLTPKIVGTTSPAPRIAQQPSGATTPLGRRVQNNKDEFASPVASFLDRNVTPRSGNRQSRVDSTSSTPCGTPNPERDQWETKSGLGVGSGSELEIGPPIRRAVTFAPTTETGNGQQGDSKFFYASDARNGQQQQQRPMSVQPTRGAAAFFYANGDVEKRPTVVSSPSSNCGSQFTPIQENRPSKFIYANGAPEAQPASLAVNQRPNSVIGTTVPRVPPSWPAAPSPNIPHQRPASPVKLASHSSLQSLKTTQAPAINTRSPASTSQLGPTATKSRRVSLDMPASRGTHSRQPSVITSPGSPTISRITSIPSSEASTPSSASYPAMAIDAILQTTEEAASPEESKVDQCELHSPTKMGHASDPLNELVNNARRERKVQDLEITNASLAAINRTLERQLRKQTAEIRRFRRLSRSGRLSLASTSSLAVSDSILTGTAIETLSLSDLDEEGFQDEDLEEESELSESESEGDLCPGARAAKDAKHRKRDEMRLAADLRKHREFLVDSQKINQSIKRCLDWTEELIKEGRKALEYKVCVSDVQFGGRVLAPPDEEDDQSGNEGHGDADGDDTMQGVDVGEDADSWGKDSQDRDSGIELPGDGG